MPASLRSPIRSPLKRVLRSPFDYSGASAAASLPAGAIGVWYADQYSATPGPHIPNVAGTPVASSGMLPMTRRAWQAPFFSMASGTLTGGQTAADATTNAVRAQGNAAANWYFSALTVDFPNGTYTMAFDVKSNTGVAQSFKMAFFGAQTAVSKTLASGTAWERHTNTFTFSGGNGAGTIPIFCWTPDNIVAGDFIVDNVDVFAGSSDLGAQPFTGNIRQFKYAGITPSITGGAIGAQTSTCLQFPTLQTLGDYTIIGVASQTVALASQLFRLSNGSGVYSEGALNRAPGGPSGSGVDYGQSSTLYQMLNTGWHVVGHRRSGTACDMWLDTQQLGVQTGLSTSVLLDDLWRPNSGHKLAALGIWPRALSDVEYLQAVALLTARAALSGNVVTEVPRWITFEGDSISAANTWTYKFGPNSSPLCQGTSRATPGSSLATLRARAASTDKTLPTVRAGKKLFFVSLIGANDMTSVGSYSGPGGTGMTGWLIDYAAYLDARKAAGFTHVVVGTILPTSNATHNTNRNIANPTLRTWVGTHCDAIIDFAASATYGTDAAGSNVAIFGDGVHPTATTYTNMEADARPVLNGL